MECWNIFAEKESKKVFERRPKKDRQAGIRGQCQLESPAKEYLEQVKRRDDTYCTEMMKNKFSALKIGEWEEYKGIVRVEVKPTEWTFDGIKEAFEQVAQDEAEKLRVVHEIMIRSTHCLRRTIARAGGQGGATVSCLCPNCNSFPLDDYIWWVSAGKGSGGARSVERNTIGSNQVCFWSYKQVKYRSGQGLQSTCSVRKFNQCVEVAGEPARIWRRRYT